MQIHISPRHIKLTPAIHAYVAQKIGHLEHFCGDIIGAHIALFHDDTRAAKHAFVIKVHLAVPGNDLHAEDHGHELYAAIDIVTDKLAEQLRHRKSKTKKAVVREARVEKAKRNGLAKP